MSLSTPLLPPLYATSRNGGRLGSFGQAMAPGEGDNDGASASGSDSDSLGSASSSGEGSVDSSSSDGDGSEGEGHSDDSGGYFSSDGEGSSVASHVDYESEGEAKAAYNGFADQVRDLDRALGYPGDGYDPMDDMGAALDDEDAPPQRSRRHKLIIVALAATLSLLLLNFAYGLARLAWLNYVETAPNPDGNAKNVNANGRRDATTTNSINNRNNVGKRQSSPDDREYQLPRYPTRIYTHTSLSSRNYRAGGVLSDEMLQRYEEDGVLVIRNLLSPKLLDRLDEASNMLIDGADEGSKKKRRGKQFHMVKNGAIFLGVPGPKDEACAANDASEGGSCEATEEESNDGAILSSFRDLAMYSKIPRVAASLLRLDELRAGGEQNLKLSREEKMRQQEEEGAGAEGGDDSVNLRICRDIFLTKDDDPHACGWHVDDTGFWPSIASDPGVNAWIALDDLPFPQSGIRLAADTSEKDATTTLSSNGKQAEPVATFALSMGSHRTPWRHKAYEVTGSTHTIPEEGFQSAADLIQRRSGSGTCNIETSAPDVYEKLESNKVIYDLKRGDVIFHDRWVFHRTVTTSEYDAMVNGSDGDQRPTAQSDKIFRRYSVRYSPGTATVPPGYGVEPSVLHDESNAGRTLDDIVERSGPWYPMVWPHVLKSKPVREQGEAGATKEQDEEEIEGIVELVHEKMPRAEELQKERKREIQRLLSLKGGQEQG
ncbi:hypothetical protein ACHAXT_002909 [Thalassiosira profunda]